MGGDIYVLKNNGQPELVEGLLTIAMLGRTTKLVKKEKVKKGVQIYLYFTGIDQAPFGQKPLLFEVSICGGKYHNQAKLYSTLAEAEAGYKEFFLMAKED